MLCTLPLPLSNPVRCFGLSGYIWGSVKLYGMINPLFCLLIEILGSYHDIGIPEPATNISGQIIFQLVAFDAVDLTCRGITSCWLSYCILS